MICCQMCHTENSVAKVPVWLSNIDSVPNSVPSEGGLSPRGPTEEVLTLESSSGGSEAVEGTVCAHRTPGAPKEGGVQVKHSTDPQV